MPLTDVAARKAKPTDRPFKMGDSGGLYLLVNPTGSKLWNFKYRFGGKERSLAIGPYPLVSIAEAREKRDAAKRLLLDHQDPSAHKRRAKAEAILATRNTFGLVAEEYLEALEAKRLAPSTMKKHRWLLNDLAASFANRPVRDITAPEVLELLRRIERSGKHETAKKLRADLSRVFKLAMLTLRADTDPTEALRGAIAAPKHVGRSALTSEKELGTFIATLNDFSGWPTLKSALKFQILTLARPGEARGAQRAEFEFDRKVWRIPAERMKMRRPHEVPLSRQALELIHDVWPYSERGDLVFPSIRSPLQRLSENAFNAAIRRMGYASEEVSAHGFRVTASTILNSRGYDADVIEAALAHQDENTIRRAYNRATYWEQRVVLMQEWADLLDSLSSNSAGA